MEWPRALPTLRDRSAVSARRAARSGRAPGQPAAHHDADGPAPARSLAASRRCRSRSDSSFRAAVVRSRGRRGTTSDHPRCSSRAGPGSSAASSPDGTPQIGCSNVGYRFKSAPDSRGLTPLVRGASRDLSGCSVDSGRGRGLFRFSGFHQQCKGARPLDPQHFRDRRWCLVPDGPPGAPAAPAARGRPGKESSAF